MAVCLCRFPLQASVVILLPSAVVISAMLCTPIHSLTQLKFSFSVVVKSDVDTASMIALLLTRRSDGIVFCMSGIISSPWRL